MTLRNEFPRTGQWLFRWRSYLPLAILALILFEMRNFSYFGGDAQLDVFWVSFCLAVSGLGLLVRVLTVGHAPGGTSGRNTERQIAEVLNTTGMYSVVRHPLYLANYLIWLGIALLPHSWWLAVLVTMTFWLYYERIMFAEEEFLGARFGPAYSEWASRTPAFIPNLRLWRPPSLPFCLRTVLRREYSGVFAVVAIFTVIEVVGDRVVRGRWILDDHWLAFFLTGAVVYLTLRALKRSTRMLHVDGR